MKINKIKKENKKIAKLLKRLKFKTIKVNNQESKVEEKKENINEIKNNNLNTEENKDIVKTEVKIEKQEYSNQKMIEPPIHIMSVADLIRTNTIKKPKEEENENEIIDNLDSYFPKYKTAYDQDSSSINDFPEAEAQKARITYKHRYR